MITYGFSIQGKSHIERGVVCQDYSKHMALRGGWYLGVVADGVGSAAHSDIGSRIAVEILCDYCKKNIEARMTDDQLEDMLCSAYEYAYEAIVHYVEDAADNIEEYDTTLSSALYNGDKVIYGHAGDGGILLRLCDGRIKPITKRQKGADGSSVLPLRAGISSWDFGIIREKTASVLLATDGMLDGVFQPVLVNLPRDISSLARGDFSNDNAYITVSEFFMNPDAVYCNPAIRDADAFMHRYMQGDLEKEDQEPFLHCVQRSYSKMFGSEDAMELCRGISKYYYAVWTLKKVTDDKSVVCMMNEKAKAFPQNIDYYREPNWKWRQESYDALLYGRAMPPIPCDDPLYFGNGKDAQETEVSVSAAKLVSKRDNKYWKQRKKEQVAEQGKRKRRIEQFLESQRRRKQFFIRPIVAVLVLCFVVGVTMQTKNIGLNNYLEKMKEGGLPIGSQSPTPSKEKELEITSQPQELSKKEKKEIKQAAKDVVNHLAKAQSTNTKLSKIGAATEYNEKCKLYKDYKDYKKEFQRRIRQLELSAKLRELLPKQKSSSSEEIVSAEKLIDDIKGLDDLAKKKDFADVFEKKMQNCLQKKKKNEQDTIKNNLYILLNDDTTDKKGEE